jgi:hypothetical protein
MAKGDSVMASLGLRARGGVKEEEVGYWDVEEDEDVEGPGAGAQSVWEAGVAAIWVDGRSVEGGVDGET